MVESCRNIELEFTVEGETSPPGGKSDRAAIIRRILTERAGLKLVALRVGAEVENILEDFDMIK